MSQKLIRKSKSRIDVLDCVRVVLILTVIAMPAGCDSMRTNEPGIAQAFNELAAASNLEQEKDAFLKINRLAHQLRIHVLNQQGEAVSLVQENPYAVKITTLTQSEVHVLLDPTNVQFLLGE